MEEIISKWKALNVASATVEYDCGGDSMENIEIEVCDKEGNSVEAPELDSMLEDEMYRQVQFYEVSDGYYQGESGTVTITLEGDGEDETLVFEKDAEYEYSEESTHDTEYTAECEEVKLLEFITLIEDDSEMKFIKDCILTAAQQAALADEVVKLRKAVIREVDGLEPPADGWTALWTVATGELSITYRYTRYEKE